MKNTKTLITVMILLVIALSGSALYNYTFNSEHRNIAAEEASIKLTANKLQANFIENEAIATADYLDEVIATTGMLTGVNSDAIVLDERVLVRFTNEDIEQLKVGSSLSVKGRCLGYDELLEMVKIDQAILITK